MMRRRRIVVVFGAGLLIGLWAASGARALEDRAGRGLLAALKVGQPIVLEDTRPIAYAICPTSPGGNGGWVFGVGDSYWWMAHWGWIPPRE